MTRPSKQSELINKEVLSEFELRKLQRMAAYLYDENARLQEQMHDLNCKQFKWFNDEECWIWQGDGSDNLKTLVCPVVISPKDLMKILKRRMIKL